MTLFRGIPGIAPTSLTDGYFLNKKCTLEKTESLGVFCQVGHNLFKIYVVGGSNR